MTAVLKQKGPTGDRGYPVRPWSPRNQAPRHSRHYSDSARRRFARAVLAGSGKDPESRALQAAADACEAELGWRPGRLHGEAAFGLLHRQVEGLASRRDRLAAVLLAIAVLQVRGEQVHIVTESDHTNRWLVGRLGPILNRIGIAFAQVTAASTWNERQHAWAQPVVMAGAREIAMDFLRDALRWPGRADRAGRAVEPLLGRRSRQREMLMQGLPWSIHIDADSTLIDNARTPVVLTQDGHPMYEIGALRQAMELAAGMQRDDAFALVGEGAEVVLLESGYTSLQSMAEQYGGIWLTPRLAELMLTGALTASRVLENERHYDTSNGVVRWLLQEPLIPGMSFYGREFLTRFVEIMQDLNTAAEREAVGRVSYQQVFNRYSCLSGVAHDVRPLADELRRIYGLKSIQRNDVAATPWPHRATLVPTQDDKFDHLVDWISAAESDGLRLVVTFGEDTLAGLRDQLADTVPAVRVIMPGEGELVSLLEGCVVTVASELEREMGSLDILNCKAPQILLYERSPRLAEDRRYLHWLTFPAFRNARISMLLSRDDRLFERDDGDGIIRLPGTDGVEFGGRRLERILRRAQKRKAKVLFALRQNLMLHDVSMDALLAFSGKGIFR